MLSKYKSPSGWFSIEYPGYWEAEESTECVSFFPRRNGVGALQVSAYRFPESENPKAKDQLIEYLGSQRANVEQIEIVEFSLGSIDFAHSQYVDRDGRFWGVWIVISGDKLALITYNSREGKRDSEFKMVEQVVESLAFSST